MWVTDKHGIQRWIGEFPEPDDEELLDYGWISHTMHGTLAGYDAHIEQGNEPCVRCQRAHDGKPKRAGTEGGRRHEHLQPRPTPLDVHRQTPLRDAQRRRRGSRSQMHARRADAADLPVPSVRRISPDVAG